LRVTGDADILRSSIEVNAETQNWDIVAIEVVGQAAIVIEVQSICGIETCLSLKAGTVEDIVNNASLGRNQSD
jgi:hypothetical protein